MQHPGQGPAHMYLRMMQDRPTSWPAPRGMISTRFLCRSSRSVVASRFTMVHQLEEGAGNPPLLIYDVMLNVTL